MATEYVQEVFTGDPQPKPGLAEPSRAKLDSIVQQMVKNRESDSAIQMVVNDFKQKYSGQQAQQWAQPEQSSDQFKGMSDWLDIPKGYQPMNEANIVQQGDHTIRTNQASQRVKEHLLDIDNSVHNLLYESKKDVLGRVKSQELALNPKEAAPFNYQAQQLEHNLREDVKIDPSEVKQFKDGMESNHVMLRQGLAQKAKDLAKTNPEQANLLKGDVYRLDRQANPDKEKKVSENIDKINKGEYDYDVANGVLVKREGFFASLARGYKQKNDAFDDYDVYRRGDEKEILKLIGKRLKEDPDEATPVPDGPAGEAGVILGGQPLKPLAAAGIAGYFSGGTAGAAAAAAVSAPEMYRLTFGSSLPHNFDALKKQNPSASDSEILQKAIDLTNDQANVDALSGAAMGAIGAKAALKPTTSLLLQKSVKSALKQIGETVAVEGIGGGAAGAAGQLVKNLIAQKSGVQVDESEGMAQQLVGGAFMTLGMAIAGRSANLLKPSTYNKLLHGLSKAPDEVISAELNRAQEAGAITSEDAQRLQKDISDQRSIDASIRGDVPESDRLKVQEKIKQRDAKEKELETAHKAYHPEIKEEIKKLDDDILSLSKGSERGELQKLVDKAKIEGATKEYLRDLDERELKAAFKEISEQAHDPNSANQALEVFGEEIVSKAKEMYPKTKEAWQETRDEYTDSVNKLLDRTPSKEELQHSEKVHKVEIEAAIKDGKFEQAVATGELDAEKAKQIIESAGLEVPKGLLPSKESAVSVTYPKRSGAEATVEGVTIIKPERASAKSVSVMQPGEIKQPETITIKPQERTVEVAGEMPSEAGMAQLEGSSGGEAVTQEGNISGQEGAGVPPLPPAQGRGIYAERPDTQLSFRGLQETANEFGFEDVKSRDRVSDFQERRNAEIEVNDWVSKGEYQKNIDDLLGRIERKEMAPVARQRLILEQYLANEKQKARDLYGTPEHDTQLRKVERIKKIGEIARQETAASLRLPDEGSGVHPINDEADAMIAKMDANSVDKLTDQQKAEVRAQVEKYKGRDEQAKIKTAEVGAVASRLDAQKEFNKVKSTTKRVKKTTEERAAFRRSEVEAARKALRKLRTGESGLSAVPLPGVRELMAIAPHVKNIMVDLVAQGVDNLQDVVKQLHEEFKEVLDGITEKNIHDIIAGEYNEKGKPISELRRQIRDIQDEAKYINKLESLLAGKEPKEERAKRQRNQKIKAVKDKIKDFRKEAQDQFNKEKEAGEQAQRDYINLETERDRQLKKVSDLKEKLDSLQKGEKPKGSAPAKKIDTPEIESLKKQVADAERELNKTIATEKRIKGLEEELDRLQQRKEKQPKETNKREATDREKELKEQIEAERKAFRQEEAEANKFYKEELDEDAKKLIAIKKRNQKREHEIKAKIAAGEFEKEVKTSIFDREDIKKNYPRLRRDALDAIAKKEDAQHEFDLSLFNDEMEQRSAVRKGADFIGKVIHTTKAVMSGIDDSATFVQNGLAMLANPKVGAKVWLEHWKDAFNDARFKRELAAIHARPDWDIIKNSGLDIVEPHSAASKKVEEAFEKNLLAGKIKIKGEEYQPWKYTGGIFERAFTSMGNNMRLALFEKRMAALKDAKKTFESHPQEYKDAARVINELTGRGKLPEGIAQAAPFITPFIWAPRMLTSTLNTLGIGETMALGGKGYYQNLTPMQRKFALSQLGRGVGIGVAVMGAAALGGATVDYDPRSVTFGDVIVGDHHYNVFGRYTPVIKAIVQVSMGERLKKGNVQDLDSGKRGSKTRVGVIGGFFRGKMTPAAGAGYDLLEGKNYFTQEPFGVKDLPAALTTPMSIKELREGWENDGTWTILNRFLPAFEGLKVSDERDFNKKKEESPRQVGSGSRGRTRTRRANPHKRN